MGNDSAWSFTWTGVSLAMVGGPRESKALISNYQTPVITLYPTTPAYCQVYKPLSPHTQGCLELKKADAFWLPVPPQE
jgi:hypothetical protein